MKNTFKNKRPTLNALLLLSSLILSKESFKDIIKFHIIEIMIKIKKIEKWVESRQKPSLPLTLLFHIHYDRYSRYYSDSYDSDVK